MTSVTLSSTLATLSATLLTLSPTVCVAFRFCAIPIQASSCVSLSSLFNASSMPIVQSTVIHLYGEYLLNRLCLISFVAIPRIESTSTII
ncbi:hypothetical protein BGY98DRAFT_978822 [Russula aff. rugulosa BPL654]|nr:hypothetical protein BGY98DRAFT_978822 [Russula aff. rugulosa BPL654]